MFRKIALAVTTTCMIFAGVAAADAFIVAPAQVWTVAGNGATGFGGDGGPATSAEVDHPFSVALTSDGGYLIADKNNNRVRKVSDEGTITTVAGTGAASFSGDNGPATDAAINSPYAVSPTSDGGFLIADTGNNRIRKVLPNGNITTVAGTGTAGFFGDDGAATDARIDTPTGVVATTDGGFLILDYNNNRVREVSPGGTITTVAGNGSSTYSGDNGAATGAGVYHPFGASLTSDGGFLVADSGNNRIRKVDSSGQITTVAGNGVASVSGNGGPATGAAINDPVGVTATPDGGFMIAEWAGQLIRKVSPSGTINYVAGNGVPGYSGDGGSARSAQLSNPTSVAPTPDGGFLVADSANNRIRWVGRPQSGATGAAGGVGATGSTGAAGTPGATGPSGAPGAEGARGPQGPTGATGRDGKVKVVTCRTVKRKVKGKKKKVKRKICRGKAVSGKVSSTKRNK